MVNDQTYAFERVQELRFTDGIFLTPWQTQVEVRTRSALNFFGELNASDAKDLYTLLAQLETQVATLNVN